MKLFVILLVLVCCALAHDDVLLSEGKIVGGKEVDISNFPYQVSVRIYDQLFCGGSIINDYTVVTAAHCVHGINHKLYNIRVGNNSHEDGEHYRVIDIIEYPNYDPVTQDFDIAIIKVDGPIQFNSRVQPVALQSEGLEVPAGTTAWVSGWGQMAETNFTNPALLRAVDVEVITEQDCDSKYGPGRIGSHSLCAQSIGHDSCKGDSGGPLVADGNLIGVVSWGRGCARPNYPGVYTKISDSDIHKWIVNNL